MTFKILLALGCATWLLSCGASLLALYRNVTARPQRWLVTLIISCAGLLTAYFGLSLIHLKAWRTVNGQLQWSVNSYWFFLGAVILGAASVALTLWNCRKARTRGKPGPPPPGPDSQKQAAGAENETTEQPAR